MEKRIVPQLKGINDYYDQPYNEIYRSVVDIAKDVRRIDSNTSEGIEKCKWVAAMINMLFDTAMHNAAKILHQKNIEFNYESFEWCACFVSWCANECGYIDTGVIPKYAGCVNGVQWFKDRGQWVDGSAEPVAGMIIFFDWDSPDGESGPQDGLSDHTGIVQKVENGIVYTVEGNSGDSVRQKQYSVGYYEILGYGVPQY